MSWRAIQPREIFFDDDFLTITITPKSIDDMKLRKSAAVAR
jgi:hypothetical protein